MADTIIPEALTTSYRFEWYEFTGASDAVAGVFAFPLGQVPLVYGFGAGSNLDEATLAAGRECLQRLAFLWGESLPSEAPLPRSTPDFHQEHYLFSPNVERIRRWLSGDHVAFAGTLEVPVRAEEPRYVDLTPDWLESGLRVSKAIGVGHVPLCFGRGHPLAPQCPEELMVHPIV